MKKVFENLEEGEHIYNKYPDFKTESYRKRIFQFGYNQAIEEFEKMIAENLDKIENSGLYQDNAINYLILEYGKIKNQFQELKSSLSKREQ